VDGVRALVVGGVFLIGPLAAVAVAGGAVRALDDGAVEVMSMFVRNGPRGNDFRASDARGALEEVAARCGYRTIRLETC